MTNRIADISLRQAALVAGGALLIMAITAGFTVGYVFESLIVSEDAAATANNIRASEMLFRTGILGWLIILILDVFVAWALYVLLKPVHKSLSLLTAWLRLVYAAILGTALLNLVLVLLLLSDADYLTVFETNQLHALVSLSLNAFSDIWSIGLVVFGLHLSVLGYLVFKSRYIPTIWGVLLMIAALGYLITNVASLLLPHYEDYKATFEMVFIVPMIIGEVGLAFWLLIKSKNVEQWEKQALESA